MRSMIEKYGSLEMGFAAGMNEDDEDVIPAMTRFASEIVCAGSGAGVCLIPDPCRKSACKRLNLFLRWMVRSDNVDPGGWERGAGIEADNPARYSYVQVRVSARHDGEETGEPRDGQGDNEGIREDLSRRSREVRFRPDEARDKTRR